MYALSQHTSVKPTLTNQNREREFLQIQWVGGPAAPLGKERSPFALWPRTRQSRNPNFPDECSDRLPWKLFLAARLVSFVRKRFSKFSWILKNF